MPESFLKKIFMNFLPNEFWHHAVFSNCSVGGVPEQNLLYGKSHKPGYSIDGAITGPSANPRWDSILYGLERLIGGSMSDPGWRCRSSMDFSNFPTLLKFWTSWWNWRKAGKDYRHRFSIQNWIKFNQLGITKIVEGIMLLALGGTAILEYISIEPIIWNRIKTYLNVWDGGYHLKASASH